MSTSHFFVRWRTTGLHAALLAVLSGSAFSFEPCRIEVVEKGSGWPVPLIELRTTHAVRLITDNDGVVAFDLPELMGRETWLSISGNGYSVPADGFGMRGVRITPQPSATIKIEVTRQNIAKRLGRATGGGLFAESQKLGRETDWRESGILGCDSVQNAVHRGKLFWVWGDTTLANYPLGIYHTLSATSEMPPLKSFEPPLKLKFDYFTDAKGNARGVAKMAGEGPTWLGGYTSLPDKAGVPHLVANYVKVKNHLEVYESGLCVWNEATLNFDPVRAIWKKSDTAPKPPVVPDGQPAFWQDSAGKKWVLFGNPFPYLRCPATFEAWQDSATWETLKPQQNLPTADGKTVKPHTGSIAWNAYRKRWVTVFVESSGKPSYLGEVWYAEADAPEGPWGTAVKVLTHDNYTFYNPRLHADFTPADSPVLIFEGTYTEEFANHPVPTPRYNYNQVFYRLDLNDPALASAEKK